MTPEELSIYVMELDKRMSRLDDQVKALSQECTEVKAALTLWHHRMLTLLLSMVTLFIGIVAFVWRLSK